MRSSLSQLENIYDLSVSSDDDKPRRPIHHRPQKAFDLNDAKTLKVIKENSLIFVFFY